MAASDDDLVAVAEALYAGEPSTFVTDRTARAKAARAAGDRDLAARITALPKPSAAASLVNRLVHDGDGFRLVLELGAALRAAQQDADGDRLRALGGQRRDLLAEMTRTAADGAERRPSAAVLEEVQQTLQAVLVDAGAADAARTGRLVHALAADGLDPADLTDAIGGPGGQRSTPTPTPSRTEDDGEAARRRAEEAARERAETARRAAEDATGRARDAEQQVQQRDATVQDLTGRIAELQEHLGAAQRALDDATRAADEARSVQEQLERTAADAESDATKR